MRRIVEIIICVGLVLLALNFFNIYNYYFSKNAYTSISYANGKIIFIKDNDIFEASVNSSDLKRLTKTKLREIDVALSSSGKQLVFSRQKEGQKYDYADIFLMDLIDNNVRKIYNGIAHQTISQITFSSDEKKISFYTWNSKTASGVWKELDLSTGIDIERNRLEIGPFNMKSKIDLFHQGPIFTENGTTISLKVRMGKKEIVIKQKNNPTERLIARI